MDPGLYAALDDRLRALEREAAALRADLRTLGGAAVPVAPSVAVERAPHGTAARTRAFSLERLLAGRGLQLAGLFLVLLGAAFFLNLAFSRGWIGPAERIVLGLVAGVALISLGAWRRNAADVPVAESLIGLGSGLLYLSLWAAVAVFPQLHVSRGAAFLAMIAVTAVLVALASTRRSERIALLGLAGGFLTPVLLDSGPPDVPLLAGYVLFLATAFGALSVRARFRIAAAVTLLATLCYTPSFQPNPGAAGWNEWEAYAVFTLLFAMFAVTFSLLARRFTGRALGPELSMLGLNALWYAGLLEALFARSDTLAGAAVLLLGAALLAAAYAGVRANAQPRALTAAYRYLGVAVVTLALPSLLHHSTLWDTFAVEGALLVIVGARRGDRLVTIAGAALLALCSLAAVTYAGDTPPLSTPFSSLALTIAMTVGALVAARRALASTATFANPAGVVPVAWSVVTHAVALVGISRVLLDVLGGAHWNTAVPSHAQFALSLAWTAYATALFSLGMRGRAFLRWEGLALFAITIGKVFAVDLGNVDIAWRIASFVALGLVCIALSVWYMRAQAAAGDATTDAALPASGLAEAAES